MNVPDNFMFAIPGEHRDDQKVTTNIGDIVWVYLANNNHWVMVHLDIEKWQVIYYDPMLDNYTAAKQEYRIRIWCDKAVDNIGRRHQGNTICVSKTCPDRCATFSTTKRIVFRILGVRDRSC